MNPGGGGPVWARAQMGRAGALVGDLAGAAREGLGAPSRLPGWRRAHVLSHLARNADALSNLLIWARTGIETPMYESAARRARDIDEGARRAAAVILEDLDDASRRLDESMATLPEASWSSTVRTNSGRTLIARDLPWVRARELWIHAVDLDLGVTFADLPAEAVTALLAFAAGGAGAAPGCPPLRLEPVDGPPVAELGGAAPGDATVVAGPAAALVAWVLGRAGGEGLSVTPAGPLPALADWL